ncbi:MAG TPA: hypothetical protein VN520_31595 [Streptomyces sp.]|uniref:hypothetical protein n=1 Tax=Streptomyces sp. TaxID=1931 RepID=UPI002C09CAFF|nr:hypothetical protein [Streptomyces sp.]HWU10845.1 hypothetical protein [Streptomyces sp.]
MPDPLEIAVISSALPATLTFLFQRVERLLNPQGPEPEEGVAVPDVLVGDLRLPLQPHEERLQNNRGQLEALRDALVNYTSGEVPVRTSDQPLLRNLTRLRATLENIYEQRLTFEGEDRPASGPFVHQKLTTLSGEATGMDADAISGNARVIQDVETVDSGAKLVGMKGRRIGPQQHGN